MQDNETMTTFRWGGLQFWLGREVFRPRESSEAFIDFACSLLVLNTPRAPVPLVEMCCGSGALGLALYLRAPQLFTSVLLLDSSRNAVATAEANRRRYAVPGTAGLWRAGEPIDLDRPALILCNPPFLAEADADDLPLWERTCVAAANDGLAVIRDCFVSLGATGHHCLLKSSISQLPAVAVMAASHELGLSHRDDETNLAFSYWRPRQLKPDAPNPDFMVPPTFGVELEFFLLGPDGYPALGSVAPVIERWRSRGLPAHLVPELGSFQLELNPGPWPLSEQGVAEAIASLVSDVAELKACANDLGFTLNTAPIVPRLHIDSLTDPAFLTSDARSRATSAYFSQRKAVAEFEDGDDFVFPGETILACLDEIHIHVQLASESDTLALFNELNRAAEDIVRPFQSPILLNGKRLRRDCTTMRLFEQADGEPSLDGALRRVGTLPFDIRSAEDYRSAVVRFNPIPCPEADPPFLDLDRSVWLWTRLRGQPGSLRVEFRPMDMGEDWIERVRYLADTVLSLTRSGRPESDTPTSRHPRSCNMQRSHQA